MTTDAPIRWSELDGAIARDDFEAALGVALEAWRATRHEVLADLVDAIASHVRGREIDARSYHAAWLAVAREDDPRDLGALLAGLRRAIPRPKQEHWGFSAVVPTGWIERVDALAARSDDPRMTLPIVAVLRAAPWQVYEQRHDAVYHAPLRLLARIGDRRALPALEELLAAARERRTRQMGYVFVRAVPAILEEIARAPRVELSEADAARGVELAKRLGAGAAPRADTSALLARIYEDPDDDGARQVYADALLEAGDPRGEFMALQLAAAEGRGDDEARARAEALQRAHRAEWLGDLAHVLSSVVFERGMLASGVLEQNAKAAAVVWERAAADARLATMHTLIKGRGNERHYASFAFSPAMRSLRSVTVLSNKMLETMCAEGRAFPFEELRFEKAATPKALDRLAAATTLPRFSRLVVACDPDEVPTFVESIARFLAKRRIDEVSIAQTHLWHLRGYDALATWFGAATGLAPTTLGFSTAHERVRASPGETGLVVELDVRIVLRPDVVVLALPPVERLVVRARKELHDDPGLRAALAALAHLSPELVT